MVDVQSTDMAAEAGPETTFDRPQPRADLLPLHVYVPGSSHVDGVDKIHKLSANETPLGPSPKAQAALAGVIEHLEDYPDGGSTILREAIATAHGLNPENILCGNGSDEFFSMLAMAYLRPGDEAIHTRHGFLVYPTAIVAAGATPVVADEVNLTADVDCILAKVTTQTKMVFLANPNNPTGTYLPFDEVRRLHQALPAHVMLILDGAYAEYVRRNDYSPGIELVASSRNVVMTRTFSKIHGLAALRVGWMYAQKDVIDVLHRIRGPFNVNTAAQVAGAAAIHDQAHVDAAVAHNETWLAWVTGELESLGLTVTPSVGNFVLIHFPKDGMVSAEAANALLRSKGYLLRGVAGYGLPDAIRLSIGSEESLRGVVAVLREALVG